MEHNGDVAEAFVRCSGLLNRDRRERHAAALQHTPQAAHALVVYRDELVRLFHVLEHLELLSRYIFDIWVLDKIGRLWFTTCKVVPVGFTSALLSGLCDRGGFNFFVVSQCNSVNIAAVFAV